MITGISSPLESMIPDEIGDASARGALFCAADCENDRFTLLQ